MDTSIIFCYIIGAVFAFFGVVSFIKSLRDKRVCVRRANAEVVEYETRQEHSDNATVICYYPVFSYYAEGKKLRGRGSTGSTSRKYPIGTVVDILYEPDNPSNFIIPTESSLGWVSFVAALIGIGLLVIAYLRTIGIMN